MPPVPIEHRVVWPENTPQNCAYLCVRSLAPPLSHRLLTTQVFNGSAPYLLYEGHPTNLPPAMRRHREASKTAAEKVVAIFRETVLPCLSPSHHHHYHHHHRTHSGGAMTTAAAAAAVLLSGGGGGGGGSFRGCVYRLASFPLLFCVTLDIEI